MQVSQISNVNFKGFWGKETIESVSMDVSNYIIRRQTYFPFADEKYEHIQKIIQEKKRKDFHEVDSYGNTYDDCRFINVDRFEFTEKQFNDYKKGIAPEKINSLVEKELVDKGLVHKLNDPIATFISITPPRKDFIANLLRKLHLFREIPIKWDGEINLDKLVKRYYKSLVK